MMGERKKRYIIESPRMADRQNCIGCGPGRSLWLHDVQLDIRYFVECPRMDRQTYDCVLNCQSVGAPPEFLCVTTRLDLQTVLSFFLFFYVIRFGEAVGEGRGGSSPSPTNQPG
jgi:hypothetical protein